MKAFSKDVSEALDHYVYRLIDPRNGQTFYVGKGRGNRVFSHVRAELKLAEGEDELSEKLKTIREIRSADLKPVHIIHRHGMDEETAAEVEAALIDHTPGLANEAAGRGSRERGPANAIQLQDKYERQVMEPDPAHKLLFIKVRRETVDEREGGDLYEAVRRRWVLSLKRANEDGKIVLGVVDGVCKGVFTDCKWKRCADSEKRIEFKGRQATAEKDRAMVDRYIGKLIPAELRKPGLAFPCLYWPQHR